LAADFSGSDEPYSFWWHHLAQLAFPLDHIPSGKEKK